MSLGDILLVLAALSALTCIIAGLMGPRAAAGRAAASSRFAALAAFASISGALVLLAAAFASSDLSYRYVWSHSSTGLDAFYKLVGVGRGAREDCCCGLG